MSNTEHYLARIRTLERELDEMTAALSHAWDQLVPFLQEVPAQAETTQDIVPILHAVVAAADTDLAGIYRFETREWLSVPHAVEIDGHIERRLRSLARDHVQQVNVPGPPATTWVFVPILSEGRVNGALGIGTAHPQRAFTAVDVRIITRMAERVGSQIAATQLARIREREAALQHEMQIARSIQQSIQPEHPPSMRGIQMAAYWQPAQQVGGDAWGWVQQSETRLAWFVLDISGKGLPAALAAMSLNTSIRLGLRMHLSPAQVLRLINEEFYDPYTRTDLIATVIILSLNAENGALEIANAGHPPALVRRAGDWLRLPATAPPIGVLPELQAEPQHLMLYPNDLILAYSDGFTEIRTGSRLWGQTGLLNTIPNGSKDIHSLTQHIVAAAQRAGQIEDDQSLVNVMYTRG